MRRICVVLLIALATASLALGQSARKKERKGELYFSWGYNKEWYTHSNVRVMQPSLGNDYRFSAISGHDHPGWDEGLFNLALSIPQYNYRLGFFFNKKKNLAFEINFDHTKFIFADQNAHLTGTLGNRAVDTTIAFNRPNGFFYYLNNGANFLLFNIVKRWSFYRSGNDHIRIDALGKAGIGPVIPHVENAFFGNLNDPHFQLGGWNLGFEGSLRATFFNTVYLEFSNKLDYASYSGLKIYQGTASQAFGTEELILSLGFCIPTGKHIP